MAARKTATKTKAGCKRAGGTPVHFKGMKRGEVACFGLGKKKKATKKRTTKKSTARKTTKKTTTKKRKQTPKQRAASLRNLKKARRALRA